MTRIWAASGIGLLLAWASAASTAANPPSPTPLVHNPPIHEGTVVEAAKTSSADDILPDTEELIDEVLVDRDAYERMTVPVTIDGQGPFRFLIDTGAQATAITHRVIDRLQLQPSGRAMLVAMGSEQMVDTVELDDVEFANRRFNGITAPLLQKKHIGADGILGLDSLQRLRVVMDFIEGRISVTDAPLSGDSKSGYEIVVRARRKLGQMIITDARVDGIRTAIVIDTGSAYSFGNEALRRKLRARKQEQLSSTDVNGANLVSDLTTIRSMKIAGLVMKEVPIGFHESPAFKALGLEDEPAIILGMYNLRAFDRIAIDFASQNVLFDLPPNTGADPVRAVFSASRIGSS